MAKDFSTMEDSNRSSNPSIHQVLAESRRRFLKSGVSLSLASVLAPLAGCASLGTAQPKLGFKGIPVVIHSSLTGTTNENHVKGVGADGYVGKFAPRELAATLRRVLG